MNKSFRCSDKGAVGEQFIIMSVYNDSVMLSVVVKNITEQNGV